MKPSHVRRIMASTGSPALLRRVRAKDIVQPISETPFVIGLDASAPAGDQNPPKLFINMITTWPQGRLLDVGVEKFQKTIELACEYGRMSHEFEETVITRLKQGRLLPSDLANILFKLDSSGQWKYLKKEVIEFLLENSDDVFEILSSARILLNCPEPNFQDNQTDDGLHNQFHGCQAKIRIDGREYRSCSHSASDIRQAERLALIDIFAQVAGVEPVRN